MFCLCEVDFVGFCCFPILSFKLTFSFNLKAQTSFFLSFLFPFLHTCFSLFLLPCLVSLRVVSTLFLISICLAPPLSLLSVHPSLTAALWQQSVMGLGCRRTVKAIPRPSSSSSAPLHPCCPLPKGPPQSIFTQVMRRAETQKINYSREEARPRSFSFSQKTIEHIFHFSYTSIFH